MEGEEKGEKKKKRRKVTCSKIALFLGSEKNVINNFGFI
jgi:hypothetical protein